ncbi:MAG: FAD-dependent oxidoreductase [Microbacteriaceae bacterium]|nr:MAG: FAD-dependent oxidoreductase [Microbacteriaceae bacterium]
MRAERLDTVVIGAGAMGLAAAWQLMRRGVSVTLLERFNIGNVIGASHGATRNFNQAYSDPAYLAMLVEALGLWRELEVESDQTLLDTVGIVNHGASPEFDQVFTAMTNAGIPAEFLPPVEAARRWPGMRFDTRVLFAPQSGRLRASAVLQALRAVALAGGADIREGTEVTGIKVIDEDRVQLSTSNGMIMARRLIVTAGAWTDQILGGAIELPRLVITQEQPAHFMRTDDSFEWPSFNHNPTQDDPVYDYWYSPVYGVFTPGEGVKVGWHGSGPVTDPDARTFVSDPDQLSALQQYVREWLPGADPDRFTEISCTYTTTPDSNFVLKHVGPVTVGAGFSGHGFKFTPVVGRILADLSTEAGDAPALQRPQWWHTS